MRYVLLLLAFTAASCGSKKKSLHDTVTGNWFVLYPDDELLTEKQNKIYAEAQDSITGLKCLKLISFSANGEFSQLDSIQLKGKWGTRDDEQVVVNNAGKGFDNFKTVFDGFEDGVLRLTETVPIKNSKLQLVWHLKKIEEGEPARLFATENNTWRTKPTAKETDIQIKKRIAQMMNFYALYFELIAEESSYFMPGRVMLPFSFYQHGIGLKEFDAESRFTTLFYDKEQAKKAHLYLGVAIDNVDYKFKATKSYSAEYAEMLKAMAAVLAE
jgi:hypothetical protein